jgi:hypothetical protein
MHIALAGTIRPLSPIKTLASIGVANKGTDLGNAAARAVGGNNAALNMTLRTAMLVARRIKLESEEREAPEASVSKHILDTFSFGLPEVCNCIIPFGMLWSLLRRQFCITTNGLHFFGSLFGELWLTRRRSLHMLIVDKLSETGP